MMEPEITVDIFGTSTPQYAVSINPTAPNIRQAVKAAERVDLGESTCGDVLPLVVALQNHYHKRNILSAAQCVFIYRRIWARPGLEKYQNSVLMGLIMHHLELFDLFWLASALGCNTYALSQLYPHVERLINSMGESRTEFSAFPYVEIICVYFEHNKDILKDAQLFSTSIETTAQLIPVGQLSAPSIAAVAVFFASLKHRREIEIEDYIQIGQCTAGQFEGLCDWVYCTKRELWSDGVQAYLTAKREVLWYPQLKRNVKATLQLFEKSSQRQELGEEVRAAAYKLPKSFYQRGLSLCSAACVLAVTGEANLDEQVLNETLWLSRWTNPQLQNYRKLIESYLKPSQADRR